jgi:hypothetical protein
MQLFRTVYSKLNPFMRLLVLMFIILCITPRGSFAAHYFPGDTSGKVNGNTIDVHSFGAKGDGIADDDLAIQQAIDYCAKSGGGAVIFHQKQYKLKKKVSIRSNIKMIGAGARIKWEGGKTAAFEAAGISNFGIDGLVFSGKSVFNNDGPYLLSITSGSFNGDVNNCSFSTSYIGVFVGDVSTTSSSHIAIRNSKFTNIGLNAIGLNCYGQGFVIENNTILNCGLLSSKQLVGSGIEFRGATNSIISGNLIEQVKFGGVGSCDGIRLESPPTGEHRSQVDKVFVSYNTIRNFSGHGIRMMSVSRSTISNNIIVGSAASANGILLYSSTAKSTFGNVINYNTISGCSKYAGIAFEGDDLSPTKLNSLSFNDVAKCYNGLAITYSDSNTISYNTVAGCSGQGIVHYSGSGNCFVKNSSVNSFAGAAFISGSNAVITENNFKNNKQGLYIGAKVLKSFFGSNKISGNSKNIINNSDILIRQ